MAFRKAGFSRTRLPAPSKDDFLDMAYEYLVLVQDVSTLDEHECSICNEAYSSEHVAIRINSINGCNHVFGRPCFETWAQEAPDCPMCRTVLYEQPPIRMSWAGAREQDLGWLGLRLERLNPRSTNTTLLYEPWLGSGHSSTYGFHIPLDEDNEEVANEGWPQDQAHHTARCNFHSIPLALENVHGTPQNVVQHQQFESNIGTFRPFVADAEPDVDLTSRGSNQPRSRASHDIRPTR